MGADLEKCDNMEWLARMGATLGVVFSRQNPRDANLYTISLPDGRTYESPSLAGAVAAARTSEHCRQERAAKVATCGWTKAGADW